MNALLVARAFRRRAFVWRSRIPSQVGEGTSTLEARYVQEARIWDERASEIEIGLIRDGFTI